MCSHAPDREGQWWRGDLRLAVRGTLVIGDSSTCGESRLWRSWWSVHVPELGLPKNLVGKSFRQ